LSKDDAALTHRGQPKGDVRMKAGFWLLAFALMALGTGAAGAANSPSANVESIATVSNQITVVFEFDLYNCPAGSEIIIDEWTANEPSRPDSGAVSGLSDYGLSNGDRVQHLVLQTGASSFLPGEQWVGSGTISCGATIIPVAGAGQTKSVNGGV
jgi:hypothetical protein